MRVIVEFWSSVLADVQVRPSMIARLFGATVDEFMAAKNQRGEWCRDANGEALPRDVAEAIETERRIQTAQHV